MPRRRLTISETRWPENAEFVSEAQKVMANIPALLLGYVWKGYDLLVEEVLSSIDLFGRPEDVERDLTERLEIRIRRSMTGYEPFDIRHGVAERESRQAPPAQPPEYDLAFALRSNERIMWPLEAKVLATDGQIADYTKAVRERFLTCYYAPFSSEGSMLGYLNRGRPEDAFVRIGAELACSLAQNNDFRNRPHKVSLHTRKVPDGKAYPSKFRCHHMILSLTSDKPSAPGSGRDPSPGCAA